MDPPLPHRKDASCQLVPVQPVRTCILCILDRLLTVACIFTIHLGPVTCPMRHALLVVLDFLCSTCAILYGSHYYLSFQYSLSFNTDLFNVLH
ncbi:hypothetical protein C8Q74DRAFT_1305418 [Fomes fomentarius]|nr:hypothetical protein C8Q74DRAFT_1305153 [Fomes fomentarius]KAI0755793.1 hypothetical protein C8Q74DRAFT_1305418 [Fomes fomentarius]